MAKVIHAFYCTVEKRPYKVGDEYKGKRKELIGVYVEAEKKAPTKPKAEVKKKPRAKKKETK